MADIKQSEAAGSKAEGSSDLLVGEPLAETEQLLLQDEPDGCYELQRSWLSENSAESDFSLFSENNLLLNQD